MTPALSRMPPFLFLLILLFFQGCASTMPCEVPADCPANHQCLQGECKPDKPKTKSEPARESKAEPTSEPSSEPVTDASGNDASEPDAPDSTKPDKGPLVLLSSVVGDGTKSPIVYGGKQAPKGSRESPSRFRTHWVLHGKGLHHLTDLQLVYKKQPEIIFDSNDGLELKKGTSTMRTLKLPAGLATGLFILIGFVGPQKIALGEVFVLQGERGKQGTQGSKGDIGPRGEKGLDGKDGGDCKIANISPTTKGDIQIKIECGTTNSTFLVPAGKNGKDGKNGVDGKNGKDGRNGVNGKDGKNGVDGKNGKDGAPGLKGDKGDRGVKGDKGDKGDGFNPITLQYVTDLQKTLFLDTKQKTATFSKVNLHINNGSNSSTKIDGYGNLIIGYNRRFTGLSYYRTGSHNLIVGDGHSYKSYGGIVAGYSNTISGPYSSVTGGRGNDADGEATSIVGGFGNTTRHYYSTVTGGNGNKATGNSSSVSGGTGNESSGKSSSICGGKNGAANSEYSSIAGGSSNRATHIGATVLGGYQNHAAGMYTTVTGGRGQSNRFSYTVTP